MAEEADQSWHINVNVQGILNNIRFFLVFNNNIIIGKTFNISVGDGVQRYIKYYIHKQNINQKFIN